MRPTAGPRNGVDVPSLFATRDVVRGHPDAAKFQFRARNRMVEGTHSVTEINDFFGVGEERSHRTLFTYGADHPEVLTGADNAPTPVEFLLHALASCLTAGIANIAAARGVTLTRVESQVTGDIDLMGLLGLDETTRNGYQEIRVNFEIEGEAAQERLKEVVEQSVARSAVYDVLTNGVPVKVGVSYGDRDQGARSASSPDTPTRETT